MVLLVLHTHTHVYCFLKCSLRVEPDAVGCDEPRAVVALHYVFNIIASLHNIHGLYSCCLVLCANQTQPYVTRIL